MKKSEALAAALAAQLAAEARIEEAYGPEPEEDGAVIAFRVRFMPRGPKYHYAAIRANGLWYTTGPTSPKGYGWDELVSWLDSMNKVTGFKRLR